MSPLLRLFAFSLVPVVVMLVAGAAGILRAPGPRFRSAVLHFAAGVIFAVVAVELLPDVLRERAIAATLIGFAVGTVLMLVLRSMTRRLERRTDHATTVLPLGLLLAIGIDLLIDGLMIGIGFAAGARQGVLLTIALAFEMLALGLALAATLGKCGAGRGKTFASIAGLSVLLIVGAVAGGVPLAGVSGRDLAGVLAFGSAALLFLVTEELLGEAHETEDTPALAGAFFFGFLLLLLLDMVG
ncbi:MAG: ZIP family metal transporter [Gammaproteobacteria bacterium]